MFPLNKSLHILTLTSFLKQYHPCQSFIMIPSFCMVVLSICVCVPGLGGSLNIVLGLQGGKALTQAQSLFSGSVLMNTYSQVKRKNGFLLLKR